MKETKRFSLIQPDIKRRSLLLPKKKDSCCFKSFLSESIYEKAIRRIQQSESNKSYGELLIEELQKPEGKEIAAIQLYKRQSKDSTVTSSLEKRNIDLIIYFIEQFKHFYQFLRFNKIQFFELKMLATQIKYLFCPKGSYIFKAHERSGRFFCVIKGSVSMVKRIVYNYPLEPVNEIYDTPCNSISRDNFISHNSSFADSPLPSPHELRSQFEVEQQKFTPGMCFGEWNLIDNTIHSTSAYCNEDTHLFYLTKDHFDAILSASILQTSLETKAFVYKCIPLLSNDDLNQLKPEFYDKGRIVYSQFTKATDVFIIFQGECRLTIDPKAKNEEDVFEKRNKKWIISIVNKGGVVGLEAAYPNTVYENNLEVSMNYTVLYRLSVQEIEKRVNMRVYLRRMKEIKNELYSPQRINRGKAKACLAQETANEKVGKLMLDLHKKKQFNEFKPILTQINYSTFYRKKEEENKPWNLKGRSFFSPVNKQTLSRNCISSRFCIALSEENKSLASGNCSKFQAQTLVNEKSIPMKLMKSSINHRKTKSTLEIDRKKKKLNNQIKDNQLIKKTLNQLSINVHKKIIYNTGNYNLPLLSKDREFSQ